jgi:phosphonate transport system substrate-binding protein
MVPGAFIFCHGFHGWTQIPHICPGENPCNPLQKNPQSALSEKRPRTRLVAPRGATESRRCRLGIRWYHYSRLGNLSFRKMKRFLFLFLFILTGCNLPGAQSATPTATAIPIPTASPAPTAIPQPTAELGSDENPLILALAPSAQPDPTMVEAGEALAAQLESLTGYQIVTVAPLSESELVHAFSLGNAHLAVLTPFGYLLAHANGDAQTALASVRAGQALYGAQFLARRSAGFDAYFDPVRGENTAEALQALAQFEGKKPCWSDAYSPSGYVVPLGVLNAAGVHVREAAFLEGQAPLVRAVYTEGICDFGASYIDARQLPALEQDYPDVMERVIVIWRVPAIIPYEQLVTASSMNPEMRRLFVRAFVDLMSTPEGLGAVRTVYGLEALQPAEDSAYTAFADYVRGAGLELSELLR